MDVEQQEGLPGSTFDQHKRRSERSSHWGDLAETKCDLFAPLFGPWHFRIRENQGRSREMEENNDIWMARHFAASQSELRSEKALIGVDLQDGCDFNGLEGFSAGRSRSHQGKVRKSKAPSCRLGHQLEQIGGVIGL